MQAGCELLAEAIEEIETDGKLALSGDIFRQAIGKLSFKAIQPSYTTEIQHVKLPILGLYLSSVHMGCNAFASCWMSANLMLGLLGLAFQSVWARFWQEKREMK